MFQDDKDKLFCEAASDLHLIDDDQISTAISQQQVDAAIGIKKPISAYLFEAVQKQNIAYNNGQKRLSFRSGEKIVSKPTYEELEQQIVALEKKLEKFKQAEDKLRQQCPFGKFS